MQVLVIILCSMSGALIGTAIGILLMYRKVRQPITDAELAVLKGNLLSSESSLATRTAEWENLQRQIVERDQTIQRHEETVRERQQQVDAAVAERDATELRAQELRIQAEALSGECARLEAMVQEEKAAGADIVNRHAGAHEAQLDEDRRKIQELTDQVARATAESNEIREYCEQERLRASFLETQHGAALERIQELTNQIEELQIERSRFDLRLQEERQSAAKGMELLLMAQKNLARVFNSGCVDAPNGSDGHRALEAGGTNADAGGESVEEFHPALALLQEPGSVEVP